MAIMVLLSNLIACSPEQLGITLPPGVDIRLRLDAPSSAYFSHPKTGLRVDLLFDFPVPASQLAARATRITVRSQGLLVASEDDLLNLKRIARAHRVLPGDAEDIAFLEARRARS